MHNWKLNSEKRYSGQWRAWKVVGVSQTHDGTTETKWGEFEWRVERPWSIIEFF
jgi:hypothetical protein